MKQGNLDLANTRILLSAAYCCRHSNFVLATADGRLAVRPFLDIHGPQVCNDSGRCCIFVQIGLYSTSTSASMHFEVLIVLYK